MATYKPKGLVAKLNTLWPTNMSVILDESQYEWGF